MISTTINGHLRAEDVKRRAAGRWATDDTFAVSSYVMPALALSLVGPLSLHALVVAPLAVSGIAADSDSWFGLAIAGTVHVHLAFAIAMGVAAWRVARGQAVSSVALYPAVLLSFIPGALLVFPPVLVWVCGFIVSRAFLRRARRWYAQETSPQGV